MEKYSIKLEHSLRQTAQLNGVQKLVVGAAILNEDKTAVLLLKRHPSDFMPNLDELPSGGVILEESLYEALAREVKEETGLEMTNIVSYINFFDYYSQSGKLSRQFNFLVETSSLHPIILSPEEHSSFSWNRLEDLGNATNKMKEIIELIL